MKITASCHSTTVLLLAYWISFRVDYIQEIGQNRSSMSADIQQSELLDPYSVSLITFMCNSIAPFLLWWCFFWKVFFVNNTIAALKLKLYMKISLPAAIHTGLLKLFQLPFRVDNIPCRKLVSAGN